MAIEAIMLERGLTPTPPTDRYREWALRYKDDFAGFARDCIRFPRGQWLGDYQAEILGAFTDHDKISARGTRGLGKTAIAAIAAHAFALTRDGLGIPWKIPTSASNARQLIRYLWPEIRLWAPRIRWGMVGRKSYNPRTELLKTSLNLEHGQAYTVVAPTNREEGTEGAHAEEVLLIYDEAKEISDAMFDASEGIFSTGNGKWFVISTPGAPVGRFYAIHSKKPGYEKWWTRHVSWQEAVAAGRIKQSWVDDMRLAWGEDSVLFKRQVLGEFAAQSEDSIIPLAWVEAAMDRWEEDDGPITAIGVDVGNGGDLSVIACVRGKCVAELQKIAVAADPATSTMGLAGIVGGLINKHNRFDYNDPRNLAKRTFIDSIGIGAGVVHRLREMGYPVSAFNAALGTTLKDEAGLLGFANWRAAGWWTMRELLDPAHKVNLALPDDDDLKAELTAPRVKRITSEEKRLVESKAELLKANRLGRSTDCADAVIHALVGPVLLAEWERAEGPPEERVVYEPYEMPKRW
ncbi:hypothetical protein LCGC14_0500210 [marine sediment metagenome]|uniref:Terminase large subunit gp17-like C-terminal domain-containing protein n=1 Tax=marine sediment metagenome TaxID=412755 RepID=A0A0F9VCN3_9ZZZZ